MGTFQRAPAGSGREEKAGRPGALLVETGKQNEKPSVIVLHTIKGKDCTFAEDVFYNHHMTFTQQQLDEANQHLDQLIERLS